MKKLMSLLVAAAAAAVVWIGPIRTHASSHREAPLISQDPLADNTDVYAFVSPNDPDRVTLIANFIPLEAPYGGPNFFKFDDNVLYEIMVDNDGDAVEDVTFQFRFRTDGPQPEHVPLQHRPDHVARLAELQRPPVLLGDARSRARAATAATTVLADNLPTPPVNVGFRSTPNYDALAAAADPAAARAAARSSPASATTRSSSI